MEEKFSDDIGVNYIRLLEELQVHSSRVDLKSRTDPQNIRLRSRPHTQHFRVWCGAQATKHVHWVALVM